MTSEFDVFNTDTHLNIFFNTNEFAETVTYTPNGGIAKNINIIQLNEDAALLEPHPLKDSKTILVKYADVNEPNYGDIITWGGDTWYVINNYGGGQFTTGTYKLEISRSNRRRII